MTSLDQYKQYVKEAKEILRLAKYKQMEIARLALLVCDIHWGGRSKDTDISVNRFAKDIGTEKKTLHQWISMRRRVLNNLDPEISRNLSYDNIVMIYKKTKANMTAKDIRLMTKEVLEMPQNLKRFIKYTSHAKSILFNSKRPDRLELVNNEKIEEMISHCSGIAAVLKEYLADKESGKLNKKIRRKDKIYKEILNKHSRL